jgi:hypothetical protein
MKIRSINYVAKKYSLPAGGIPQNQLLVDTGSSFLGFSPPSCEEAITGDVKTSERSGVIYEF